MSESISKYRRFKRRLQNGRAWLKSSFRRPGQLPDAIIAGAMKGGTTSLHFYLRQHEQVHVSFRKEVHFFDENYHRGMSWYRRQFPRIDDGITIESTPRYMFHPEAIERMQAALPDLRVIVVLRDPVARAYSHYQHAVRKGMETRSFAEAAAADIQTYERHGLHAATSLEDLYHSIIRRSIYAPQIKRLQQAFGNRLMVLRSRDIFQKPLHRTNDVLRFLDLRPIWRLNEAPHNSGGYIDPIEPAVRRRLERFFAPFNNELYDALNVPRWWDAASERSTRTQRRTA